MSTSVASRQRSKPAPTVEPALLTRTQVAQLCGFKAPLATDRLVKAHADFPRPIHPFPRSPRWLREAVLSWLRAQDRAVQEVR